MRIIKWGCATLIGITLMVSCGSRDTNKGDELFSQGKYKESVEAYTDFLAAKPKNMHALYNRGRAHEELEMYDKAESDFLAALEQEPKNIQVLLSLSNIYQKQKNHNSALLYAAYAVEVPGAPAMAYFMKGRALHQIGSTDEALKEYSTAIKMDKNFGQAHYYRGMLKVATENKRGACEDFNAAVRLNFADANAALQRYCQ